MKKIIIVSFVAAISACMIIGCGINEETIKEKPSSMGIHLEDSEWEDVSIDEFDVLTSKNEQHSASETVAFHLEDVPEFSGVPSVEINGNVPYYTANEVTTDPFEVYSTLDEQGRCGVAYANICKELMPTEERGEIGMIKPSGWHTQKYPDIVEGGFVYNRCHLIGFQLAGENANEKNLITGTRYLNVNGMLPYENMVAEYILGHQKNHVLYRVTPVYKDNELVARGVLMEAYSVEDGGTGIAFCVYCYNVQPGLLIEYSTGKTSLDKDFKGDYAVSSKFPENNETDHNNKFVAEGQGKDKNLAEETTYVVNISTGRFHCPTCGSVADMATKNILESTETRDALINEGYLPCGRCNP